MDNLRKWLIDRSIPCLFDDFNDSVIHLRSITIAGLTIQSETHDSTEDANTALQLYRKYEQFSAKGEFRRVLKQLYDDGRKSGWKVEENTAE